MSVQWKKYFKVVTSIQIGINEWFAPQISEHCPKNNSGRYAKNVLWLIRPGTTSILISKLGIVQAWITSVDEINNWVCVQNGITISVIYI